MRNKLLTKIAAAALAVSMAAAPANASLPVLGSVSYAADENSSALLKAPKNVRYTLTGDTIRLKWDKVSGADGYTVYMYNEAAGKYRKYRSVAGTVCTIGGAETGSTYKFIVASLVKQSGKYVRQNLSRAVTVPVVLNKYWTAGSVAAASLRSYVAAVTDEASKQYIPVKDRIAVFDLDGTLMCETYPRCFEYMVFTDYVLNNENYTPTDEIRAVAQEIIDTAWEEKPSGISTRQAEAGALAYSGLTVGELQEYVENFKSSAAEGFTDLKRGDAWYKPMLEIVDYLKENEFTIYIVTATERNIVRAIISDVLDIPPSNVIGTEYGYKATGQGETADGDYTFASSDKVVFDGTYYGENAKMCKVDAIVREIGQQPVLAFGNSSGDQAMLEYTITGNKYRSGAYMVVADDEKREYGSEEKGAATRQTCIEHGWTVISMRDDFSTIYGENVKRTH